MGAACAMHLTQTKTHLDAILMLWGALYTFNRPIQCEMGRVNELCNEKNWGWESMNKKVFELTHNKVSFRTCFGYLNVEKK
jgi:hypothetical protein